MAGCGTGGEMGLGVQAGAEATTPTSCIQSTRIEQNTETDTKHKSTKHSAGTPKEQNKKKTYSYTYHQGGQGQFSCYNHNNQNKMIANCS